MKNKYHEGISLRLIQYWMIAVTVLMALTVLVSTYMLTRTFQRVTSAGREHNELQKAAHELMDASDYLTENVQRFTVNGDVRFLENYFDEAFETNRREEALNIMNVDEETTDALKRLQEAMNASVHLMEREYYAMKLVIEAKGYTDYPDVLNEITLSDEDKALTPEEKIRRATQIVLDDEYYEEKDMIRANMKASIEEIDKLLYNIEAATLKIQNRELLFVRVVVILLTFSILVMVWLTAVLGIRPVLTAVDKIREDSPVPEMGAKEFRYLAQAYNKMYSRYRNSLESLNFKASHDELTGAYNRAGYDLLISSIDPETTYMMLFDVDNFKNINDFYGHETGDRVLVKLVQVLKSVFRDDDCICRVGGDEFVVFMVHSVGKQRRLIESKIEQINRELENTDDGLPGISISVGIVHGEDVGDASKLFEKTDEAMYKSKNKGKHTYTFYSG